MRYFSTTIFQTRRRFWYDIFPTSFRARSINMTCSASSLGSARNSLSRSHLPFSFPRLRVPAIGRIVIRLKLFPEDLHYLASPVSRVKHQLPGIPPNYKNTCRGDLCFKMIKRKSVSRKRFSNICPKQPASTSPEKCVSELLKQIFKLLFGKTSNYLRCLATTELRNSQCIR